MIHEDLQSISIGLVLELKGNRYLPFFQHFWAWRQDLFEMELNQPPPNLPQSNPTIGGGVRPLIDTKRLLLRPMQAADFDELFLIFTDPNVMEAFDSPPFNRQQMDHWLKGNLDHQDKYGYGLFSVILKANESLIGDCGLEIMEVDGVQVAELGYDFRSDYWHQGYATEAATAVRDYAFQVLNLPQLVSLIRVGNQASRRVAEKLGMQLLNEFTRYGYRYWKFGIENEGSYDGIRDDLRADKTQTGQPGSGARVGSDAE